MEIHYKHYKAIFQSKIYPYSFGIFLAFLIFNFGPCKKIPIKRIDNERESGSTVTLHNFQRDAFNDSGVLQWRLSAKEAYLFLEENKTVVYSMILDQYEKGEYKSKIIADKGELNHKEKKVKLNGNINVKTSDKELLAEELFYDLEGESLESDKKVTIITDTLTLKGQGLSADKNLSKFTIKKPEGISHGNPISNEKE